KQAGKMNQAIEALQKAAAMQVDYFRNYQELCALQTEQANYEEAFRYCKEMVRVAPEMSDSHYALGTAYMDSGRYSEGENELRTAISIQETSKAVHNLPPLFFYHDRNAQPIQS